MEALPFVILGAMVSVVIRLFAPTDHIIRRLPRRPLCRSLSISLLGTFMPVCECGNVSVARGLVIRGLSVAESTSFLLAAPDSYVGKEVDVVGFVFHPDGAPADVFYVSRFSVNCCAVAARPLGLPVYSPNWQEDFEEDSWVRVAGSFAETKEDIPEPVIVTPESIEPTEQPGNPYVN